LPRKNKSSSSCHLSAKKVVEGKKRNRLPCGPEGEKRRGRMGKRGTKANRGGEEGGREGLAGPYYQGEKKLHSRHEKKGSKVGEKKGEGGLNLTCSEKGGEVHLVKFLCGRKNSFEAEVKWKNLSEKPGEKKKRGKRKKGPISVHGPIWSKRGRDPPKSGKR